MIARLLISKSPQAITEEIEKVLELAGLKNPHPDLLFFQSSTKLGINEAKKIKEHFSLKPYSAKGRTVILEDASALTQEAQNALLKTLEELPKDSILILGSSSDTKLLPTILSRCQIVRLQQDVVRLQGAEDIGPKDYSEDIGRLLKLNTEERFEFIEGCKEREEFLHHMVEYFHKNIQSYQESHNTFFLKEILQAEEWATQNVNIRAILEYLMLIMPKE